MFADLHVHSSFSDGTFPPEAIAACGRRVGLAAMALCDHDTVEGCARMARACRAEGLEWLSGTELTVEVDGHEVHLLGYGIDIGHGPLLGALARFQEVRRERVREMVARLNRLGIALTSEAVFELAGCRAVGRPHLARALVRGGFCGSLDQAFERFLKRGRPAWVPKYRLSGEAGVALIHEAGGLAVMAHPGLEQAGEFIPEMVAAGLDGLECFHSRHGAATADHYLRIADQYGLLVTGGSDCHGDGKAPPLIGTVKLPWPRLETLRERWAARQARPAHLVLTSS